MSTIFTQNGQQITNDFVVQITAHPQTRSVDVEGNVTYQTTEQTLDVVVPFGNLLVADDATLTLWGVTKNEVVEVPASITRRQCARRMMDMTLITPEEALAMTKSGEPPALVAAAFAQMTPEDAVLAAIDFAADTYVRANPLLVALMTATGATEADIDQFFRDAALL